MSIFRNIFKKRTVVEDVWEDVQDILLTPTEQPSDNQLEQMYDNNSIVYSCVSEIAKQIGSAEIEAPTATKTLLEMPNEDQTWSQFVQIIVASYYTTGIVYIKKVINGNSVQELVHLSTSKVTSNEKMYTYNNERLDRRDLIIISEPSLTYLTGLKKYKSPLRSCWSDYRILQKRQQYQLKMLNKLPHLVNVIETNKQTTNTQRKQLGQSVDNIVGSEERSTLVLPEGTTIKSPGILQDASLDIIGQTAEANICSVFNVPPVLIGCMVGMKNSTFNNYDTARKSLYTETILPFASLLSQSFSKDLGQPIEIIVKEPENNNE